MYFHYLLICYREHHLYTIRTTTTLNGTKNVFMMDCTTSLRRRQYLAVLGATGVLTLSGCNNLGADSSSHSTHSNPFPPDDTKTLPDSENVDIDQYIREGQPGSWAPYTRIGQGAYEASPSLVGTRETGAIERLVGYDDVSVTATTFTSISTSFTYGYLESAPNRVPVLKVICVLRSPTPGETLDLRVGTEARGVDTPLMEFGTGTDTEQQWLYDEVYLNEVDEGTAARKPTTLSEGAYRVWGRVSSGEGTVHAASTLIIDWEVV